MIAKRRTLVEHHSLPVCLERISTCTVYILSTEHDYFVCVLMKTHVHVNQNEDMYADIFDGSNHQTCTLQRNINKRVFIGPYIHSPQWHQLRLPRQRNYICYTAPHCTVIYQAKNIIQTAFNGSSQRNLNRKKI